MDKLKNNIITILLADDHPLLRKGLKDIIEETENYSVIAEAGDGENAIRLIRQLIPSVAIIDIQMPKLNGLEVVNMIKREKLPVEIIVLTMYDKENIFNRAIDLGVKGYVIKDSAASEIVDAISNVVEGKYYISSSVSGFLVKRSQIGESNVERDVSGISALTIAEKKILKMIASSMTTKEIADELNLSIHTVEKHRYNICQKLNLSGTNALLRFALLHPDLI